MFLVRNVVICFIVAFKNILTFNLLSQFLIIFFLYHHHIFNRNHVFRESPQKIKHISTHDFNARMWNRGHALTPRFSIKQKQNAFVKAAVKFFALDRSDRLI